MNRRHLLAASGGIGAALIVAGGTFRLSAQEATPPASPAASPAATPAGATPGAATETTVQMIDIAFEPKKISIPADTEVTIRLPNHGAAAHNFNIDGKNNPSDPNVHSGDVPPGEERTVTVTLPAGEWYYYCSIPGHEAAGMFGTIEVE